MGKQRSSKKRRRRAHRPIGGPVGTAMRRTEGSGPARGRSVYPMDKGAGDGDVVLEVPGSSAAVGAFRAKGPVNRLVDADGQAAPVPTRKTVRKRRRPRKARGVLRRVISVRRIVQGAVGVGLYVLVARYNINLWWVVLFGSLLGIVLGKVFCRWMCPMGFVMETLMGSGDQAQSSMYMYFKVGCPIAWISGLLNKVSLFRVKLKPDKCSHCGVCEEACYISEFNETHGLHRPEVINASTHYSCSRCLACVSACPTGALTLGTALPARKPQQVEEV